MTGGTVNLGSDLATRGLTPLFLVPGTAQRCKPPLVDPLFLTGSRA
jgi:hypothetical protein